MKLTEAQQQLLTYQRLVSEHVYNPLQWVNDRTDYQLTGYQARSLTLLAQMDRPVKKIAIRGPRGLGKSFLAASTISWFIDCWERLGIEWAVQTIGPSQKVLSNVLWPAIHKAVRHIKDETSTKQPHKLRFVGNYGLAVAQAVAPGREVNLEGMHAPRMLVVFDEAKGIRDAVWESIPGSFSEAGVNDNRAIWLAISTPGPKQGRFYDIFNDRRRFSDWDTVHVTLDEAIRAGRVSDDQARQAAASYGIDSAYYQNHWLGEFFDDESEMFMPPEWVDESFTRWEADTIRPGFTVAGVDPARTGSDRLAVAYYKPAQNRVDRITVEAYTPDTVKKAEQLASTADAFIVDADGLGGPVVDALRNLTDKPVIAFHNGGKTSWLNRTGSRCGNQKTAAYLNMLEKLDPVNEGTLQLPPHNELRQEILAQQLKANLTDILRLQSKDQVKERIGRSPDMSDALAMALFWEADNDEIAADFGHLIPQSW